MNEQEHDMRLRVFDDRSALGASAAADIAASIRRRLAEQGSVRMVFAAAPSQTETLAALAAAPGIDWSRVTTFHMDEYIGLDPSAPERFGNWLREHLFDALPFEAVHLLDPADDPDGAAERYATLLGEAPVDIVVLGIGENGHIAFNDPPVADFDDPRAVKVVELDDACRLQQVADDCFATVDDVPTSALTLTIPTLVGASELFCVVPGVRKAEAVRATLEERVTTSWPSTVLRTHDSCTLYVDADAASLLSPVVAHQSIAV